MDEAMREAIAAKRERAAEMDTASESIEQADQGDSIDPDEDDDENSDIL